MPELTTTEELSNRAWKLYEEIVELKKASVKQSEDNQKLIEAIKLKQSESAEIIAEIEAIERQRADQARRASRNNNKTEGKQ